VKKVFVFSLAVVLLGFAYELWELIAELVE
jgi:hypothetical protein